jgi:hypothetical protein
MTSDFCLFWLGAMLIRRVLVTVIVRFPPVPAMTAFDPERTPGKSLSYRVALVSWSSRLCLNRIIPPHARTHAWWVRLSRLLAPAMRTENGALVASRRQAPSRGTLLITAKIGKIRGGM